MKPALVVLCVLAALAGSGYLAACAGGDRWLTLREWLGPFWRRRIASRDPEPDSDFLRTTGVFLPETPADMHVPGPETQRLYSNLPTTPEDYEAHAARANDRSRARWQGKP